MERARARQGWDAPSAGAIAAPTVAPGGATPDAAHGRGCNCAAFAGQTKSGRFVFGGGSCSTMLRVFASICVHGTAARRQGNARAPRGRPLRPLLRVPVAKEGTRQA